MRLVRTLYQVKTRDNPLKLVGTWFLQWALHPSLTHRLWYYPRSYTPAHNRNSFRSRYIIIWLDGVSYNSS